MPARIHPTRPLLASALLIALAGIAWVSLRGAAAQPGPTKEWRTPSHREMAKPLAKGNDLVPFPGLFSLGLIQLQSGAIVDAWDSPIGGFLQGHTQDSGQALVRSVGAIDLLFETNSAPTVIVGHANALQGSQVRMQKGSFVTGSITPCSDLAFLPPTGNRRTGVRSRLQLSSGTTCTDRPTLLYGDVTIEGRASWVLQGPVDIQLESLVIQDRASLILDASQGPIRLHVLQKFTMAADTHLQCDPADQGSVLIVLGQGEPNIQNPLQRSRTRDQDLAQAMRDRLAGKTPDNEAQEPHNQGLNWQGEGQFYGLLYAPFSQVYLSSTLRFHGTITGASIHLERDAHVTCDPRALRAWNLLESERVE